MDEWLVSSKHSAILLAGNADVVKGVEHKDFSLLKATLDALNAEIGLSTISVTDAEGNVIIRQHQPEKLGDNILTQSNVQKALEGEVQTTIEPGKLVKLSTRAGAPIKNEQGKIIGTIVVGYTFENASALDALKAQQNTEYAIYMGSERIATTIMGGDGTRTLGDGLDERATEVFETGEAFSGKCTVDGVDYLCAYTPLMDTTGKTVGVLFAGLPMAQSEQAKMQQLRDALVVSPILVAISLFVLSLLLRRVVKSRWTRSRKPRSRLRRGIST